MGDDELGKELEKELNDHYKTTHRSYNALVWGNIVEDEGRIEGNIGQ